VDTIFFILSEWERRSYVGLITKAGSNESKPVTVQKLSVTSLINIPRPFALPVFDHLQYANKEGKAWEIWSCMCTMSCRQRAFLYYQSVSKAGTILFIIQGCSNTKRELLLPGTSPHVSTPFYLT